MFRLASLTMALLFAPVTFAQSEKTNWTDRIEMFGDIRLRHDYTNKTKKTDTSEAHKERLRLRLGAQAKVNEKIKAKVRIATSEGQTPIATNQTFTNNADKKGIFVDVASVDVNVAEGQSLLMGKIENPLRPLAISQLIYDVDYTPEGAAYLGQYGNIFARAAGFIIQERSQQANGTSEPDSWLMVGMLGYKADLGEKMALTVAAGYHNFTALKKNANLPPGTTFAGNSSVGGRYAHDYQVGEILGELRMKGEGCVISAYFDVANNFYLDNDNKAYLVGAMWQTVDENAKPIWTAGYGYQSIDKDATVSALNNSDFANGVDGSVGHIVQVGRALGPNSSLTLTWNNAEIDNNGNPFKSDKGLLDFLVSF